IVDDEALRHRKGDAELRMHEGAAAHEAFLRRVAEQHAVYAVEEGVPVAVAGPGRGVLARMAQRKLDALRGRRMAGEEVEVLVDGAGDVARGAVGVHRLQEA